MSGAFSSVGRNPVTLSALSPLESPVRRVCLGSTGTMVSFRPACRTQPWHCRDGVLDAQQPRALPAEPLGWGEGRKRSVRTLQGPAAPSCVHILFFSIRGRLKDVDVSVVVRAESCASLCCFSVWFLECSVCLRLHLAVGRRAGRCLGCAGAGAGPRGPASHSCAHVWHAI